MRMSFKLNALHDMSFSGFEVLGHRNVTVEMFQNKLPELVGNIDSRILLRAKIQGKCIKKRLFVCLYSEKVSRKTHSLH